MGIVMKDYYSEFVELCLLQYLKRDYMENKSVRKHNRAVDKLAKLSEEMIVVECTDVLDNLLLHNDERVKKNAALLCLKKNILVEKSLNVLKELDESADDPFVSFGAHLILNLYEKKDESIFRYHQKNTADSSLPSDEI